MPAQKRSAENLDEDSQQRHHFQEEEDDEEEREQEPDEEEPDEEDGEVGEGEGEGEGEGGDSDGSDSSSSRDSDEFITVKLSEIRKEVQCPICLGIIRKTRTVMECLHRFCRECIDKSMRLGNNECPACRTHCASRRSLRDDPNYDALIAALYPDIDKYEEEELAFREEEKTRNKMIQASIAQTVRRQSEALGKRRTTAKAVAAFMRRSQGQYRRGRSSRNSRGTDPQGSDDDDDGNGNDGGRDSSSADERCSDVKNKRCKRWPGSRSSQPSPNADGGFDENDDLEVSRESTGASPGFVGNIEMLAWGKGGARSHTRYGSLSGSNGKNGRNSRLAKLIDYLRILEENDKLDVHLTLVSLDEQSIPNLLRPYLCCRPTLSVWQLCGYVALETSVQAEDIEMVVVNEPRFTSEKHESMLNPSASMGEPIPKADPCKDEQQILEAQETLAGLQANCTSSQGHLVLAYRLKASKSGNSS